MEEPQMPQRTLRPEQLSPAPGVEPPDPASRSIAASSSNLRNLLTVRQEEDHQPLYQRRGGTSMSLGTVIACETRDLSSAGLAAGTSPSAAANPSGSSRTLFDIIRDEEESGGGRRFYDDGILIGSAGGGHKISWRAFKDRLRIRRAGAAWQSSGGGGGGGSSSDLAPPSPAASSVNRTLEGIAANGRPAPASNPPSTASRAIENLRPPTPAPSMGLQFRPPLAVEQAQGEGSSAGGADAPAPATYGDAEEQQQPQQIRVSLMALLEQTDRQSEGPGFAVSALLEGSGEAEEEEEEEDEEAAGEEAGKMYVKCCVCMVRHKGAAFIPCGHTFCRLCSRELWVSRGNCPLCNGFILEILDIF